jgi:hypothetical protein
VNHWTWRWAIAVIALLTTSAFGLELGNPFDTPLGREYRAELEVLTVLPKLLPSSCRLVREVKTAPIFPATTNPFVTRDPALIRFVSQIGFGNGAILDVAAAMSVLYYDSKPQHEVGVWALRFKDAEAASKVRGLASARNVFVRGLMAATVWRDDEVGQACQTAIEAHLLKNGFVR